MQSLVLQGVWGLSEVLRSAQGPGYRNPVISLLLNVSITTFSNRSLATAWSDSGQKEAKSGSVPTSDVARCPSTMIDE